MARSVVQWADDDRVFFFSRGNGNFSATLYSAYLGKDTEMPSSAHECVLLHGITLSDITDPEQKAAAGDALAASVFCRWLCWSSSW